MFFINTKSRQQATDQDLLDAFGKKQNLDDLAELYNRYIHLIYGVCFILFLIFSFFDINS